MRVLGSASQPKMQRCWALPRWVSDEGLAGESDDSQNAGSEQAKEVSGEDEKAMR